MIDRLFELTKLIGQRIIAILTDIVVLIILLIPIKKVNIKEHFSEIGLMLIVIAFNILMLIIQLITFPILVLNQYSFECIIDLLNKFKI